MSAAESTVAEATSKEIALFNPAALAQLPIPQRVAVLLKSEAREKELVDLAAKHLDIVTVTNKDGREQVHRAYMVLKNARVELEKSAEEVREDAVKFGKAVVTEQKRLVGLISAEEERLKAVRDAWDNEEERKRAEAIEKERQRVAAIDLEIEGMRKLPMQSGGQPAAQLQAVLNALEQRALDPEFFAERLELAEAARGEVLELLRGMHGERVAFEAEQLRLAEERQRLEEQKRRDEEAAALRRQEEEARLKEERERLAREQERLRLEREEQEKAAAAEREKLQAERAAADQLARDQAAARDAAERDRQEKLRLEQEERDRQEAARQQRIREDEERIAAQRLELEQQTAYNEQARHFSDLLLDARATEDPIEATSLRNAVSGTPIEAATYGQWADRLHDLRDQTVASIDLVIDSLTTSEPVPPAAAELTAAPSSEGVEAAAAEPEPVVELEPVAELEPPYPGDDQIEQGLAAQFSVSHLTARIWLSKYIASQMVAE